MKEIAIQIIYYNLAAFFVGFVLDYFFGEPPEKFHLVVFIGNLIKAFEKLFYSINNKLLGGILAASAVIFIVFVLSIIPVMVFVFLNGCFFVRVIYSLIATYVFLCSISVKSLKEHALNIYNTLKKGDLERARRFLSYMVSRDTDYMKESEIIKSTVESVSENYVDGILSPMFYFVLFGITGALVFKAVSTLDSMIGYKNERYNEFGRFAAKLDDFMNFIPARLSIVFISLSSLLIGYGFEDVIYTFGKYRKAHSSPNSAHPMSGFSGSLKVSLGGKTKYNSVWVEKPVIGEFAREPTVEDIKSAIRLLNLSSFLSFIFFLFSMILVFD